MVNHKKTFPTVGRVKYFDDNINLNHKIFITIDFSSEDYIYILIRVVMWKIVFMDGL